MKNITAFDSADYLQDEATIAAYLSAALEDENPDVFLTAVRDVARARGMAQLAQDAGLGCESLTLDENPCQGEVVKLASFCYLSSIDQ